MPAGLSSDSSDTSRAAIAATSEMQAAGSGRRLLLLLLNAIPLMHVAGLVACFGLPAEWPVRIGGAIAWLFLVPPLCVRVLFKTLPPTEGSVRMGSREFFVWWTSLQFQVIYCRFPALEELLRLVPGLYSGWLRLWGARVGRFTYWAPGTLILDRPFLEIGDDVVFGAGVRLNAHVLARNGTGMTELLLGTIRVGDRALIGGYSLLTAGTRIADDEATRAFLVSPPFSVWKNGKRVRDAADFDE